MGKMVQLLIQGMQAASTAMSGEQAPRLMHGIVERAFQQLTPAPGTPSVFALPEATRGTPATQIESTVAAGDSGFASMEQTWPPLGPAQLPKRMRGEPYGNGKSTPGPIASTSRSHCLHVAFHCGLALSLHLSHDNSQ